MLRKEVISMKAETVIAISIFVFVLGIVAGQVWRWAQVEPVYQARIEFLEEERQILRERLMDYSTQLGICQGKSRRVR